MQAREESSGGREGGRVRIKGQRRRKVNWRDEVLGWQESTLKIHILELFDEFDNLVTVS